MATPTLAMADFNYTIATFGARGYNYVFEGNDETQQPMVSFSGNLDTNGVFDASIGVDTIYVVLGCFGMVGNLFVFVVMLCKRKMMRKTTNLFIFNQCVLDLLASFFLVITSISWGMDDNIGATTARIATEFACRFWTTKYPLWALLVSSTYNLLMITIESYLEVVHPIRHKVSFSRNIAYRMMAFAWLVGPLWQTYYFYTSGIVDGQCLVYSIYQSEAVRTFVGTLNVCIQFLLPFIVLIYVYARILFVISNRLQTVNSSVERRKSQVDVHMGQIVSGGISATQDRWHGARRNAIKTMIIVAAVFVLCWSQNQLYYLMMNLGFRSDFSSPYYHFTVACIFCNSVLNPFVYALKYRELRLATREFLRRCGLLRLCTCGGRGNRRVRGVVEATGSSVEDNSVNTMTVNTVS